MMVYFSAAIYFYSMCFLYLKLVYYKQHIVGSYFLNHSDHLCLLIGAFRSLMFEVIIDLD